MTPATVEHLRCPLCGGRFTVDATALRCTLGHHFDVARQGYVNLLTGRRPSGADTPSMVSARIELMAAGHFDFLTEALAQAAWDAVENWEAAGTWDAVRESGRGLVVDVGAGPGHHLAAVLDRLPRHHGLALDVAKPAVRRAARAHTRADAAVCDVWRGLPLADGCADIVLDVFAPRNGREFRRVLRPRGTLIVATPRRHHLAEVAAALGLIGVDPHKDSRLESALGRWFSLESQTGCESRLALDHADAARLVAMGPSAWHIGPTDAAARLAELPEPVCATAAVDLRVYRPR